MAIGGHAKGDDNQVCIGARVSEEICAKKIGQDIPISSSIRRMVQMLSEAQMACLSGLGTLPLSHR